MGSSARFTVLLIYCVFQRKTENIQWFATRLNWKAFFMATDETNRRGYLQVCLRHGYARYRI